MRYIDAPPSIQQLKRWCENKNAVTFQIRDLGNLCDTTILNVDSCSYGGEENNYVIVKIRLKSSRIWSSRVEEFALKDILGYSIPEKIDSIILKPTKFFKKNAIVLQFRDTTWNVNKKLIASRSEFFSNLIKNKIESRKELPPSRFFIFKRKKPLLINLDNLFDKEHTVKLLLHFIDLEDLNDFIYTPEDALRLLEIANAYPLQTKSASPTEIENQIKNKFFELIGQGKQLIKPPQLEARTQFFLNNLKSELVAYCRRKYTIPCRFLLNYCSQIEKNNSLTFDATRNRAYKEAIRLLLFCNFKIYTLTTTWPTPELFTDIDLSPLSLHTLKLHPYPRDINAFYMYSFSNYPEESLFKTIRNSKTLRLVQIGPKPCNNSQPYKKGSGLSYIKKCEDFDFSPEIIQEFNELKPMLNARLRSFYEEAVANRFFSKRLPQQQCRLLTEFLTIEDLDAIRSASSEVNRDVENLMNSPKI